MRLSVLFFVSISLSVNDNKTDLIFKLAFLLSFALSSNTDTFNKLVTRSQAKASQKGHHQDNDDSEQVKLRRKVLTVASRIVTDTHSFIAAISAAVSPVSA